MTKTTLTPRLTKSTDELTGRDDQGIDNYHKNDITELTDLTKLLMGSLLTNLMT